MFDMSRKFRYCARFPKVLDLRRWGQVTSGQDRASSAAPAEQRPSLQPVRHRSPLAAITRGEQVYAQLRADILSGPAASRHPAALRRSHRTLRLQHQRGARGFEPPGRTGPGAVGAAARLPRHSAVAGRSRRSHRRHGASSRAWCCGCRSSTATSRWESDLVAAHHALERTPMETDRRPGADERGVDARPLQVPRGTARRRVPTNGCGRWRCRCAMPRSSIDGGRVRSVTTTIAMSPVNIDNCSTPRSAATRTEAVRLLEEHLRRTTRALGARLTVLNEYPLVAEMANE